MHNCFREKKPPKRRLAVVWASAAALCGLFIAAEGCARPKRTVSAPVPAPAPAPLPRIGETETGIASWYGDPYHGRVAASGEVYDMDKMTAAHRTLPFDTVVRVTNIENGKRVEVRITDRGPFVDGRIIDLSRAAAVELGVILPGTARVRLEVSKLPDRGRHIFVVQAGAFEDRDRAEHLRRELEERFGEARVEERHGRPAPWRVFAGGAMTREEASALARRVRAATGEALVISVE